MAKSSETATGHCPGIYVGAHCVHRSNVLRRFVHPLGGARYSPRERRSGVSSGFLCAFVGLRIPSKQCWPIPASSFFRRRKKPRGGPVCIVLRFGVPSSEARQNKPNHKNRRVWQSRPNKGSRQLCTNSTQ